MTANQRFPDEAVRNRAPDHLEHLGEWLERSGLRARLAGIEVPRLADLGCGAGWSSILLAQLVPSAAVVGIEIDPRLVEEARDNVAAVGRSAQIAIRLGDAARLDGGPFDLVTVIGVLAGSTDPIGVLAAARRAVAQDGRVLLADRPGAIPSSAIRHCCDVAGFASVEEVEVTPGFFRVDVLQ